MTHCTTCLYTHSLLKITLLSDLTVDVRKRLTLFCVSFSSSWVNHPVSTLILFGITEAWQLLLRFESKQLGPSRSEGVYLSCNWTWWAHLNKAKAHGRTTANHNKLSQPSFCGLVMSSLLFMHACWRQAKLLREDDQSGGTGVLMGGFIAVLHHSRSTTDHLSKKHRGGSTVETVNNPSQTIK